MTYSTADFEKAVHVIRSRAPLQPQIGMVLGSGLGALADVLEDKIAISYDDIPGWPRSTVQGHSGKLVIGLMESRPVVVQQGRAHFYEGYTLQQVTFPIRVMYLLGVRTLILTNAAGGLNAGYSPGDLMLINDHINFMGMAGANPLVGPNDNQLGPRFPGMTHTYDAEIRGSARSAAQQAGITLHEGVYVYLAGPNFETPAEVRMLRLLGGDAVGMSTVPEVLVARHMGMRVMACSGITNKAIDVLGSPADTNHEEVLETGKVLVPRLETIVRAVLRKL